ncbi:folylpolyglutamate synthase [Spiroplasma gladiatoris]|uniref:Folylpolyglutamate synthase n=1 Tax=Spiroplasma gladiatoris TaxID=2143 RepID=A0A4P7AGM6_9MOLU|nr:Mur ligase family protein [Spiroplasma gladiatoris]QBQ07287.1 folylpolyglutamate synthase [Spiroplasma gladiatoris]
MISVEKNIIPTELFFKKEYNLKKLLNDKGNPQNNFKVINVVGTNGKGSTANYLYNNLNSKYKSVGLFFSPAFLFHNERIQVNNNYIDDKTLLELINNNTKLFLKYELTFFEIWTYIAIEYFNKMKVEIAVIEAGIGGVKDSTNLFENQLAVCLTSLGFDHVEVLGNSIESIIENKIKIVKNNNKIYTTSINKQYENIFKSFVNNKIIYCEPTNDLTYQKYNQGIAKKLLEDLNIKSFNFQKTLLGRRTILNKEPSFIIDGCHNLDGAIALVNSIDNIKDYTILFTSSKGRENNEMIEFLKNKCKEFYVTTFDHIKAWNFDLVQNKNKVFNWKQFLNDNIKKNILVCGSLYFIPLVYEWYGEQNDKFLFDY